MTHVVEKTIYGSSLCFFGTKASVPTGFTKTYDVDSSSVSLFLNKDPDTTLGLPPKQITRVTFMPIWASGYMDTSLGAAYQTYSFSSVIIQPFVRTAESVATYYLFSGTNDLEFRLNQEGTSPRDGLNIGQSNDVLYDDPIILHTNEDFKCRMYDAEENFPSPAFDPWRNGFSSSPIVKVRVEYEDFSPSSLYYGRTSLNDLNIAGGVIASDEEVMLLDLQTSSSLWDTAPFYKVFAPSSPATEFSVTELALRGNYPFGGFNSTTEWVYSIFLHTAGMPGDVRTIRKFLRFSAGNTYDLEQSDLLKDFGPIKMKPGQFLTATIYALDSAFNTTVQSEVHRQMPYFALKGTPT